MDSVTVRDLGALDGEIVVFGGVHSNLHALEALRTAVGQRLAICTGDTVAYCGLPAETVDRLRATGWPVLAGNCERQIATGAEDCGCGFDDGSVCELLSHAWFSHACSRLGAGARHWMASLPDILTFRAFGQRWAAIHGGASAINRFLWPDTPDAVFAEEVAVLAALVGPVDAVLAGHSGVAFSRRVAGVQWVNAGAVGLPPNDGAQATRYAVIHRDGVSIRHLDYDAEGAARAMIAAGLTQGYDRALLSGWWPSEDILPPALRRVSREDDALLQVS